MIMLDNVVIAIMIAINAWMWLITIRSIKLTRRKKYRKKRYESDRLKVGLSLFVIELLLALHFALLFRIKYGRW